MYVKGGKCCTMTDTKLVEAISKIVQNAIKDTFEEVNVQEVDYNGEDKTETSNG